MSVLRFAPPTEIGLKEIPVGDAIARVRAYCTAPSSGWHTYDRTARTAREAGVFDQIAPWSILWAETLNGQPRASDVAGFDKELRTRIAQKIPPLRNRPLRDLDESEVTALVDLCTEGARGFWAPKMTKMLALYLPETVPVLDGNVAALIGLERNAFSKRSRASDGTMTGRREKIASAIDTLQCALRENVDALQQVRHATTLVVPDLQQASDVRVLDIILWTTQSDRVTTKNRWVDTEVKDYDPKDFTPVPIPSAKSRVGRPR